MNFWHGMVETGVSISGTKPRLLISQVDGHVPGPSARVLSDHLRRGSPRLRYSTLMIGDKILDLDCGNVFALDQAEVMLANTPGCLRLSVIRKALWTPSELATSSG